MIRELIAEVQIFDLNDSGEIATPGGVSCPFEPGAFVAPFRECWLAFCCKKGGDVALKKVIFVLFFTH